MPAVSKETLIHEILNRMADELPEIGFSYEELYQMWQEVNSGQTKFKQLTAFNLWLKENSKSPKTMGDEWKVAQQDHEEMARLKQRAAEINEKEGRDNHRTSGSRGPSSWNRFVAHQAELAKQRGEKNTRQENKEKWARLSPEEKKQYKS